MDERSESVRGSDASQGGKRKYEPPEILSQEVFETTALGIRSGNMRTIRTTCMAQQIATWNDTALSRCLCTLQNHHASPLA